MEIKKITRLEVISEQKRELVKWDCKIKKIEVQDKGKTFKIFIQNKKE